MTRRLRWLLYFLAGVVCGPPLLLVLVNLFLTFGLPEVLNRHPERLRITWSAGWMLVPGEIGVRDLEIRVQSRLDQWHLRVDHATARIDLDGLTRRRFSARAVHAEGVGFRYRQRLDTNPTDETVEGIDASPEIPGLTNPPDPLPEVLYPNRSEPWLVSLTEVVADHVEEVWLEEYRFAGDARITGNLSVVEGRSFAATDAAMDFDGGGIWLGAAPVVEDLRGEMSFSLGPIDPRVDSGREVLRYLTALVSLKAHSHDAAFVGYYLQGAPWLVVSGGSGPIEIELDVKDGAARPGSRVALDANDLTFGFLSYRVTGSGALHMAVEEAVGGPQSHLTLDFFDFAVGLDTDSTPHVQGAGFHVDARSPDVALDRPQERITFELELPSSQIPDVSVYNRYLPTGAGFSLDRGRGTLEGRLSVATPENVARGTFHMGIRGLEATYGELVLVGDMRVAARLVEGRLTEGRYTIDGTGMDLQHVSVRGTEAERRTSDDWWAELSVPRGTVRPGAATYLDADVGIRVRDTVPFVTLATAKNPLPGWAQKVLEVEDVGGAAHIELADDEVRIPSLALSAGPMELLLRLVVRDALPRGQLYARLGPLSLGVEVDGKEKPRFQVANARRWFDARAP